MNINLFDENMAKETGIAIQIQSVFGSGVTNEWLQSYREFYYL